MLRYLPLLLLITRLAGQHTVTDDLAPREHWQQMSLEQRADVRRSFDDNKAYDKGYTLAAFNAIESAGGLFLVRLAENSGGRYAQRAIYVAKRHYKVGRPTIWQRSRVLQWLVLDRDFDDHHARAHIDELLDRHGGWMGVWIWWNSAKPEQASEVLAWVRFFKYKLGWR